VPEDLIKALEQQFGFDKPWYYRYGKMIKDYICFDFGKSYYRDKTITELIKGRSKEPTFAKAKALGNGLGVPLQVLADMTDSEN
jgi:ABC-type dipeptide/oligopeptide/nickel transport system permease component